MRMRIGLLLCLPMAGVLWAQESNPAAQDTARRDIDTMLQHESDRAEHRLHYLYLSEERSDRTGGHLWKERVVETAMGKIRLLTATDGQPLSTERAAAEQARLADIAAHPDAFEKREQAKKSDETHAEQMLTLLHKAFLFEQPATDGSDLRIAYRPDPAYQPQSLEEKVLHAMSGAVLIDARTRQLHRIEGKVAEDVSLGHGILGTIHAGSNFNTAHEMEPGDEWRTSKVDTEIEGKAIFFKDIGRSEHTIRYDFRPLPPALTIPQAVELLQK